MKKKDKKVLEDHKKVGNKFIPPLLQLKPGFSEISYINQVLPELIWMGLLNDTFGYKKGIELASKISKFAVDLVGEDNYLNFSLASNYGLLSEDLKDSLIKKLEENGLLADFRKSLLPLTSLYSNFPLGFIGKNNDEDYIDKQELVERIKKCVEKHFDKYKTPALIIQANVIYIRTITGKMKFSSEVGLPDLEALILSPESNEAKKAGSQARTLAMMEVGGLGSDKTHDWAKFFWNENYKLDKCEF